MYLVAGVASGLLGHFSSIIDIDLMFFSTNFTPAIILGIIIFLAGRYISGITPPQPLAESFSSYSHLWHRFVFELCIWRRELL
jgi:hypothetical protein